MQLQSLNGIWKLNIPDSAYPEVLAEASGSVYHDLLRNGLMEDRSQPMLMPEVWCFGRC